METNRRATWAWLAVALAVFLGGTLYSRFRAPPAPTPSWQQPVSALTVEQRRFHAHLRDQLRAAEQDRGSTRTWPAAPAHFPEGWTLRKLGSTVNYVGDAEGLRWLVLFLEPDPRAKVEKAPPEDDEHHTLSDGTPLHVTVWTQPLTEPATDQLTAFPAAEGWVERVSR